MYITVVILITAIIVVSGVLSIRKTGWTRAGEQVCSFLEPIYYVPIHRTEAIRLAQAALSTAPGVKEGIVTIDTKHVLTAVLIKGRTEQLTPPTNEWIYQGMLFVPDTWEIGFAATLSMEIVARGSMERKAGVQYVSINAETGKFDQLAPASGLSGWIHALLDQGLLKELQRDLTP